MLKFLFSLTSIFALSACGSDETTSSDTLDYETVLQTWQTEMSPMEQALICNLYWTEPYEELVGVMTTGEDALPVEVAELAYQVMNEEC